MSEVFGITVCSDFGKDMIHKSGIRCEILIGGKIGKGNKITY